MVDLQHPPLPDWLTWAVSFVVGLHINRPTYGKWFAAAAKGLSKMFNPMLIMAGAMAVAGHVALWIPVVETELGPGAGPDKKAKVVEQVQAIAPAELTKLGVPAWAQSILLKSEVLGLMVDALAKLQTAAHNLLDGMQAQTPAPSADTPPGDPPAPPGAKPTPQVEQL